MTNVSTTPNFPTNVDYLIGRFLASIELTTSDGNKVDLSKLSGSALLFIQPGSSAALTPVDGWVDRIKQIPGAAGCTAQCRIFDAKRSQFEGFGIQIFSISGQTREELAAVKTKLGLGFTMLSDSKGEFLHSLGLRPVSYEAPDGSGARAYHPRINLSIENGKIIRASVPELTPQGAADSAAMEISKLAEAR